jgi:hypothetical protein
MARRVSRQEGLPLESACAPASGPGCVKIAALPRPVALGLAGCGSGYHAWSNSIVSGA